MGEGTTKVIVKNINGEHVPLTIDNQLKAALDLAKARVKHDWDYVGVISGLSGCLTLDTKIKTSKGIKELGELVGKIIDLPSYNFKSGRIQEARGIVFSSGKKQIYKLITSDGREVNASENHIFFVVNKKKIAKKEIIQRSLKKLKKGDELICWGHPIKIILKEKLGVEETADLKVCPNNNFFLANGILSHNSGKSTMARNTLAKYCCPWFSDKYTAMTDKEFIHITKYCKNNSAVILDESFASMNTKLIFSPEYIRIVNHLQIIRQKNLYIFLSLPNFFDLGKNMAIFRSSHLFLSYASEEGRRGSFLAFGREQKRILYVKGMKYMDYYAETPNFRGRFFLNASVNNEKEYQRKKLANLMETDKKIKDKAIKSYSVNKAMMKLNVEKGMGTREIGKIFGVSFDTVQNLINEYKDHIKDD